MDKKKAKQILCDIIHSVSKTAETTYKKAETEYRIKLSEEQKSIAESRKYTLATEFYQFMATYPMPAQYALDIEANLVLCRWISGNRYELKIPTKCKEKFQPHILKIHFKENLFHNLDLFKTTIYDQLSYGFPPPCQLIPYLQIVSIYQPEEGYVRIVVELRGC